MWPGAFVVLSNHNPSFPFLQGAGPLYRSSRGALNVAIEGDHQREETVPQDFSSAAPGLAACRNGTQRLLERVKNAEIC